MAKRPTTGRPPRLPCATPHEPRPTTHLDSFSLKAPGKCENKDKSLVTFNESKNRPLTLYVLAINVQRGNRIIVIDSIFATPFSDVFRVKVKRANSLREGERCDHLSCDLRVVCISKTAKPFVAELCFCCDDVQIELLDSLRKCALEYKVKKRSPNVSRY